MAAVDWGSGAATAMPGSHSGMLQLGDLQMIIRDRMSEVDQSAPLVAILSAAETALSDSTDILEFDRNRSDLAYVQYIFAYEVATDIMPGHRDFATMPTPLGSRYQTLLRALNQNEPTFFKIKQGIAAAGRSAGPPLPPLPSPGGHTSTIMPYRPRSTSMRPEGHAYPSPTSRRPYSALYGPTASPSIRTVEPEQDALAARFANLSAGQSQAATMTTHDISVSVSVSRPGSIVAQAPMPSPFPKQPSPTYSPAGTTGQGRQYGRRSARTSVAELPYPTDTDVYTPDSYGHDGQYGPDGQFIADGYSGDPYAERYPDNYVNDGYNEQYPNYSQHPASAHTPRQSQQYPVQAPPQHLQPRHQNQLQPQHHQHQLQLQHQSQSAPPPPDQGQYSSRADLVVSAEKLYDYLRLFDVLVLDVRNRADFEHRHIFGASVVCVPPSVLYPGVTAASIEGSLAAAPERERNLFACRHSFAIVVYYDDSTPDASFLDRPLLADAVELPLRALFEALTAQTGGPALQQPPVLLSGGIEAWASLLGFQSLVSEPPLGSNAGSPATPVGPQAEAAVQVKRRRREFNPLGPDEERSWHERAQSESVPAGWDDFDRRFPPAAEIGPPAPQAQQMVSTPTYPQMPVSHAVSRPAPTVTRTAPSGVRERAAGALSDRPANGTVLPPPSYTRTPQTTLLPMTGLVNFGASCYMNAIVQCLSGTIRLSRSFRDQSYRSQVQRNNWKGTKGLMADHFANLVQHLWTARADAVKPTTFRALCARLNSVWGRDDVQQDAKEFFDFLLDYLHEDVNASWNNPPPHLLSPVEEERRERMGKAFAAKIEWARYTKRDRSMVTNLFAGQHASVLRCRTCGCTSTTYEPFFSVSTAIPAPSMQSNGQAGSSVSLGKCLRSYCAEERLSGDEVWRCPRCRVQREASKQIFFTRAPEILVIHLKRFSTAGLDRGGPVRKIHTPVTFPLTGLDIGDLMIPPPSIEEITRNQRDRGPSDCVLPREMTGPYKYSASAVVNHYGHTPTSGHYTALVRDPGRNMWREFNDAVATNVHEQHLPGRTMEAYLLFYERVHD